MVRGPNRRGAGYFWPAGARQNPALSWGKTPRPCGGQLSGQSGGRARGESKWPLGPLRGGGTGEPDAPLNSPTSSDPAVPTGSGNQGCRILGPAPVPRLVRKQPKRNSGLALRDPALASQRSSNSLGRANTFCFAPLLLSVGPLLLCFVVAAPPLAVAPLSGQVKATRLTNGNGHPRCAEAAHRRRRQPKAQ